MKIALLKATAWVMFSVALVSSPVLAEDACLTDAVVTSKQDHLTVSFVVGNCFTEEMEKAIHNGINTSFTFFIKLNTVRGWWWDKSLANLKVSHDIRYDNLKKVYSVRLSERGEKAIAVKDFAAAKKLMSEIVDLKVAELHLLRKGDRYQVHMMAELDKIKLSFYLHYVLFFLSLWDFETDWHTIDFVY
jgi:hypothetical protein